MLKIAHLTVSYPNRPPALADVTFSVAPGERVALLGANGAGKSTLLLTLAGAILPESGAVTLEGVDLTRETRTQFHQKAGMVFQNPEDQLFLPTVGEDVAFGLYNLNLPEETVVQRRDAVLEQLGISKLRERLTHHLSGGEKRMAALAGVLAMEPSLLLLDEPFTFLDPRGRRRLFQCLEALPQALILATHDLDMAMALCDRAVVLDEGRVAADGPAQELLRDGARLEQWGLELPLSVRQSEVGPSTSTGC